MTHICVSRLTIIGSDNGLPPDRRQAIIWTNAGILLIGPLGANFSEILIEILIFSFKKMRLKVSSAKRRPFCLGLNVLNDKMFYYKILWSPEAATSDVIIVLLWKALLKNKIQWNFYQNTINVFENVACKVWSFLFEPKYSECTGTSQSKQQEAVRWSSNA